MTTAKSGAQGHAPSIKVEPIPNPLREVYERCYSDEAKEYRNWSPGENLVSKFWDWAKPYKTQSVIDYGCGTGRASLALKKRGLCVTMADFAGNCLDDHVKEALDDDLKFIEADLSRPLEDFPKSHFGFCCDVLEHVPEEKIDQFVENILAHSKHCFFQISCVEDHFGNHPHIKGDNEELHLHLTVWDYSKWLKFFAEKNLIVHASEDCGTHCIFYITAFRGLKFDPSLGYLNTPPEKLKENIRESAKLRLPQIRPYETQNEEVMLLCGGPSLNDFEDEIYLNRKHGMKLVTVNGTYDWALERGLKPSMQVIIDAREFNKRFTKQSNLTSETKFLISSAADPASFNNLPRDRTFVFHTVLEDETWKVVEEEYGKKFVDVFPIPGGCTVTLRALAALRMLGFWQFHIYGFDSCIFPDKGHHAYSQPENDKDLEDAVEITVAGGSKQEKTFLCAPWMAFQALDFKNMAPRLLNDCNVKVYGDGMIAHMVEAAAALNDGEEVTLEQPGSVLYALRPVNDIPGLRQDQPMTALADGDISLVAD